MVAWVKNSSGVKDGASCYRTIGGVRWEWFAEDASLFKAAGVRHRTAPGGGTFIHPDDEERAFQAVEALAARLSPSSITEGQQPTTTSGREE